MYPQSRLRELMKLNGLSFRELSEQTGINTSNIQQDLKKDIISIKRAFIYCDIFMCTLDYFYNRDVYLANIEEQVYLDIKSQNNHKNNT
jgi:transcriptional regulator with XRE-family HTH domain